MYSIFVLDLKLIRWDEVPSHEAAADRAPVPAERVAVS
jgi:hypothetical protein